MRGYLSWHFLLKRDYSGTLLTEFKPTMRAGDPDKPYLIRPGSAGAGDLNEL